MSIDVTSEYSDSQVKGLVDVWTQIIKTLAQTASHTSLRGFLGKAALVAMDEDDKQVTIGTPNKFVMLQIKKFFDIKKIVRDMYDKDRSVTYIVHPSLQEENTHLLQVDVATLLNMNEPTSVGNPIEAQLKKDMTEYFGILFDAQYTFDSLVVGNHNQLASAAGQAIVEDPGVAYNPFFVYGDVGLGKTHIMQAIANSLMRRDPSIVIVYLPTTKLLDYIISAIKKGRLDSLLKKFDDVDVLLLDDIQFIAGADKTQEIFHNIFNDFHLKKKQIVISSDRPPKELNNIADRLKSRFTLGLVADIQPPDYETRVAIIRTKADTKQLGLMPVMIELLAKHLTSNVREIEGAITMMSTKRDLYQRELSVDDVYDVLQTLGYRIDNPSAPSIEISTVPRMDMQGLMESMCVYYDISPEDILGTSRKRNIVRARQLLMYLAKEELDWTYERIGEFCGGKNHATVIHAIKTMKKLIRSDEYLKADYVKLKEGL